MEDCLRANSTEFEEEGAITAGGVTGAWAVSSWISSMSSGGGGSSGRGGGTSMSCKSVGSFTSSSVTNLSCDTKTFVSRIGGGIDADLKVSVLLD